MEISFETYRSNNFKIKHSKEDYLKINCEKCGKSERIKIDSFKSNRFGKCRDQLCKICFKKRGRKELLTFSDIVDNNGRFPKNHSRSNILINCKKCGKEQVFLAKAFINGRKYLDELCSDCYQEKYVYTNPEWIEKNKNAQLISQNKPEQKMKNALGVSSSWTKERKEKNSKIMKERWATGFYDFTLEYFDWTSKKNIERFNKIISKSNKNYRGEYKNVLYQSLLELSFILICFERDIPISRWEDSPIEYFDEVGKKRLYFPDFVLYNKIIVEIKGHRFSKDKNRIEYKNQATKDYIKNSLKYKKFRFFDALNSKFLKTKEDITKRIHEDYIKKAKAV
jgi:hypothetical protein